MGGGTWWLCWYQKRSFSLVIWEKEVRGMDFMVDANKSHLIQEVVVKREKLDKALITIQSNAAQVVALSLFRCTRWHRGPSLEVFSQNFLVRCLT